ncbi:MAG: NAD-dependent epimerase/dehydratase family protein [Saprospiraceae bacterium]|nr:NAD-dependent epimerase/dehydratase family protein [Saprospiraceae bacterium]
MGILITGANGQVGTILTAALRAKYGDDHVIASDIVKPGDGKSEPFVMLDILNVQRIREVISDYNIDQIYHLAAILSASGEWNPSKTWNVNLNALLSILEIARLQQIEKVFFPSSIAVFGRTTPRDNTPQDVPLLPSTVYGMSKLAGENWCNYYHTRYQLDVRSIRFPGIIGHASMPGGGTTDYAVEIFHRAISDGHYQCFLEPGTRLPMMYMPDAIRAIMLLMDADPEVIKIRYGYNIAGLNFSPADLSAEIKKHIPHFTVKYHPDFRQKIAESWPRSVDDQAARKDWLWEPSFDMESMTLDMINQLSKQNQSRNDS